MFKIFSVLVLLFLMIKIDLKQCDLNCKILAANDSSQYFKMLFIMSFQVSTVSQRNNFGVNLAGI
jgi:hypothetical protein